MDINGSCNCNTHTKTFLFKIIFQMRGLFRMTSKVMEIKMVEDHHQLKKSRKPGYLIQHLFPVALLPMPGFGCCCYPTSSQCHFQPYQADGHLHKSLLLLAIKNAEMEQSILMEDNIPDLIFQDMSSLLFLPLMRVVIHFCVNYAPSQGIKTAVKNLNRALLQHCPYSKWHQSHELTILLRAMQTAPYSSCHFPLQRPSLQ